MYMMYSRVSDEELLFEDENFLKKGWPFIKALEWLFIKFKNIQKEKVNVVNFIASLFFIILSSKSSFLQPLRRFGNTTMWLSKRINPSIKKKVS
jgi:hypothetical protein